ncbi:MAG TPA: heavy-metal-associated domain-containing protein [Sulfurivirga caldicuralii]|nr:heavy-metal-associated domain-containing protein [Sulfurivirga caldicuralii]
MPYTIDVDNIKCGGCANSIRKALLALPGVEEVDVDIEAGRVAVQGDEETRAAVVEALGRMGYPERGSVSGLAAAGAKAKSFVSCAVGKLDK